MNHETLLALFALDVAEVGEEKAIKRWEVWNEVNEFWSVLTKHPKWTAREYRRKPDLPWPKVMMQDTKQWPTDAPEWANYMATDLDGSTVFYSEKPEPLDKWWRRGNGTTEQNCNACPNWRDSLIERPKPVVKNIDWGILLIREHWNPTNSEVKNGSAFPSCWIAWNCDEHTRRNPLPDGLVVEWYGVSVRGHQICTPAWEVVTRFRIVGIQEGWE